MTRVKELERICAELYQVIGQLARAHHDCLSHPDVQKALDNAAAGRLVHDDLLPFPKRKLYGEKSPKPKRRSLPLVNRN